MSKSYPLVLSFLLLCVCVSLSLSVFLCFNPLFVKTFLLNHGSRQTSLVSSKPIESKPPRIPLKTTSTPSSSPLKNGLIHSRNEDGIKIRDDEIGDNTRSLRSSMKTPDFSQSIDYTVEPMIKPVPITQSPAPVVPSRPVPKPRRSIQQRRSSYLRSRSVELEPSDGHNFTVYHSRINNPQRSVDHVVPSERNIGRRRSRADDITIPPRHREKPDFKFINFPYLIHRIECLVRISTVKCSKFKQLGSA